MRYFIDSSAWIEYLRGSKKGEKVHKILNSDSQIFTLPLNISEVMSKVKRSEENTGTAYNAITSNAKIAETNTEDSKEAGILHAKERKNKSPLSLADAIIIKTAQRLNAKLITTDNDFRKFKEVLLL